MRLFTTTRYPSNLTAADQRQRPGFTVIEVVVVISVIGILSSLLLPAILRARATARRTQCMSNLRQLGVASTSYHDVHRIFPYTMCGVLRSGLRQCVSPHSNLLPFLEKEALFDDIQFGGASDGSAVGPAVYVDVFHCPVDDVVPGATNYRANMGIGPGLHGGGAGRGGWEKGNGSGPFIFGRPSRAAQIRDGMSNTVLFSEKIIGDRKPGYFTPWRDYFYYNGDIQTISQAERACRLTAGAHPPHDSTGGTNWLLGGYANTWYNHVFTPNSSQPDCSAGVAHGGSYGAYTARSWHPGGVNIVMADSSARFINEEVDVSVWHAIGTRANREIVSQNFQ